MSLEAPPQWVGWVWVRSNLSLGYCPPPASASDSLWVRSWPPIVSVIHRCPSSYGTSSIGCFGLSGWTVVPDRSLALVEKFKSWCKMTAGSLDVGLTVGDKSWGRFLDQCLLLKRIGPWLLFLLRLTNILKIRKTILIAYWWYIALHVFV